MILLVFSALFGQNSESVFWDAPNQCGAWAVLQVCSAQGVNVGIEDILKALPPDGKEKSLEQMRKALGGFGVASHGAVLDAGFLKGPSREFVVAAKDYVGAGSHYFLVLGFCDGQSLLSDARLGLRWMPNEELLSRSAETILVMGEKPPDSFLPVWWLAGCVAVVGAVAVLQRAGKRSPA